MELHRRQLGTRNGENDKLVFVRTSLGCFFFCRKPTTLHFRISHTYGLIFFEKMVLRFLLIKYVWLIVFTVFSLKYGLLSGYELLGFWAIFMLRTLLLIVAELEWNSPCAVWLEEADSFPLRDFFWKYNA